VAHGGAPATPPDARATAASPIPAAEFLALGPASRSLGVGPDTLRRWADEGRVPSFTTPGGHRRFARDEIARLVAARSAAPRSLSDLGATPDRLARVHARTYRTTRGPTPRERFGATARAEFREDGRRLVGALLGYLDSDDADVRGAAEADAISIMDATAARLASAGADAVEVVGTYLRARRPFLGEIAALGRRRALDGPALTSLYDEAAALLDRLLLHLLAAHAAILSREVTR
jgi:excisionase family DNA binding protein